MITIQERLRELACERYERHPNGEWGMPDDRRYAVCPTQVQPIHLRYLLDLRSCVFLDGSRPDVVADLDERIGKLAAEVAEFKLRRGGKYGRSMIDDAELAISIAKQDGFWVHSPEAVICELCTPDRMRDLVANALEYDFSHCVANDAADEWLTYFSQTYH